MKAIDWGTLALAAAYGLLVVGLVAFAFHKVKMLALYFRGRARGAGAVLEAHTVFAALPLGKVCVQCPVYNEALVVEGLLDAVSRLRRPGGQVEIQVLDDSTDDTTSRIAGWLERHPEAQGRVNHVRRANRLGYKAGALGHGMTLSDAEFFAIFDADFRPSGDFLERLLPHFADPHVGLVQARWEFANRKASLLTRFQGVFLDAHLVIEQAARHVSGLFFNFNGTAGIWRRTALEEAGGWSADTVTEDLDVSYRAQALGWRFVYRGDHVVSSELPESIAAFKSQQRRWTKGGIQVMRKQLGSILRSALPARIKREAAWHLLVGFIHPVLVGFAILLVPYTLWDVSGGGLWEILPPAALVLVLWVTIGLYAAAQSVRSGRWRDAAIIVGCAPLILSFGLAMSVANTVAVVEGLIERGGEFVRTPKGGAHARSESVFTSLQGRGHFLAIVAAELALGAGLVLGSWHAGRSGRYDLAIVLGGKSFGFLAVAALSLRDLLPKISGWRWTRR